MQRKRSFVVPFKRILGSNVTMLLLLSYLGIAVFQILWHWFLSRENGLAQPLLKVYLYHNPQTGREVQGYVDVMFPAAMLGLLTGWLGRQWSIRRLSLHVLFTAVGVIAMLPLYRLFFTKMALWWWPNTTNDLVAGILLGIVKSCIISGFFTYAGRIFSIHAHGSGDKT